MFRHAPIDGKLSDVRRDPLGPPAVAEGELLRGAMSLAIRERCPPASAARSAVAGYPRRVRGRSLCLARVLVQARRTDSRAKASGTRGPHATSRRAPRPRGRAAGSCRAGNLPACGHPVIRATRHQPARAPSAPLPRLPQLLDQRCDRDPRVIGSRATPVRGRNPVRPDARELEVKALMSKACGVCQGYCCGFGGNHAYLTVETIKRYMAEHPNQRPRDVLAAYLSHVGNKTFDRSCVYHRPGGCSLPRAMRGHLRLLQLPRPDRVPARSGRSGSRPRVLRVNGRR